MLADQSHVYVQYGLFARKWRAKHLGPEAAAYDRANDEANSSSPHYYDGDDFRSEDEIFAQRWDQVRTRDRAAAGLRPLPDHEAPGPQTWDDVEAEKVERKRRGERE